MPNRATMTNNAAAFLAAWLAHLSLNGSAFFKIIVTRLIAPTAIRLLVMVPTIFSVLVVSAVSCTGSGVVFASRADKPSEQIMFKAKKLFLEKFCIGDLPWQNSEVDDLIEFSIRAFWRIVTRPYAILVCPGEKKEAFEFAPQIKIPTIAREDLINMCKIKLSYSINQSNVLLPALNFL